MARNTDAARLHAAAVNRGAIPDDAGDWLYAGRTIPAWIRECHARGSKGHGDAVDSLPFIGGEAQMHVPALIVALEDRRSYTYACMVLERIGSPAAAALPRLLNAVDPLGAEPPGERSAKSGKSVDRSFAAQAIASIGPDLESLPRLIRAMTDSYHGVCAHAQTAIAKLGASAEPAVPALIDCLDEPNRCCYAAEALGAIGKGAAPAVPALIATLRNEFGDFRKAAAVALGKIGDPSAIEPLRVLLTDPRKGLRDAASKALGRLGAK